MVPRGHNPRQDALVPPTASDKVYDFAYLVLDLGSAMTPLFFGWLLDRGELRLVFVVSAVLMVLTIATVLQVRRRASPRTATASAR
jgi:MFS transporter, FSR family, fosmidomycin resistance protein